MLNLGYSQSPICKNCEKILCRAVTRAKYRTRVANWISEGQRDKMSLSFKSDNWKWELCFYKQGCPLLLTLAARNAHAGNAEIAPSREISKIYPLPSNFITIVFASSPPLLSLLKLQYAKLNTFYISRPCPHVGPHQVNRLLLLAKIQKFAFPSSHILVCPKLIC